MKEHSTRGIEVLTLRLSTHKPEHKTLINQKGQLKLTLFFLNID